VYLETWCLPSSKMVLVRRERYPSSTSLNPLEVKCLSPNSRCRPLPGPPARMPKAGSFQLLVSVTQMTNDIMHSS
jgi:hypothetical protein